MRGTRRCPRQRRCRGRFIPAHAGNTPRCAMAAGDRGSSPRMRGTRSSDPTAVWSRRGSSPRMRGTPSVVVRDSYVVDRFIPAHAGNTHRYPQPTLQNRFIPAHAGNTGGSFIRPKRRGSSPRMRGTRSDCWRGTPRAVHPRACGGTSTPSLGRGSSPRMRGTPGVSIWTNPRFIPAHAGNTLPGTN